MVFGGHLHSASAACEIHAIPFPDALLSLGSAARLTDTGSCGLTEWRKGLWVLVV